MNRGTDRSFARSPTGQIEGSLLCCQLGEVVWLTLGVCVCLLSLGDNDHHHHHHHYHHDQHRNLLPEAHCLSVCLFLCH